MGQVDLFIVHKHVTSPPLVPLSAVELLDFIHIINITIYIIYTYKIVCTFYHRSPLSLGAGAVPALVAAVSIGALPWITIPTMCSETITLR